MTTFKRSNIIGFSGAFLLIAGSILFFYLGKLDSKMMYFLCSVAIIIAGMPLFFNFLLESRGDKNKEQMFLEFSRDLVEGVRSGTPISKSIINTKNKDYGSLSPFIVKLANQIALGITVREALDIFSREVKNDIISRAIGLIKEADRSGGRIEAVLESVTFSISQIEKLKKERQAAIYNLTVQGYIIFLIFIAIMLVMQYKILPITTQLNVGSDSSASGVIPELGTNVGSASNISEIGSSFLYLLLFQGFFAGLVIGKISEGNLKSGLKHSFILVAISLLVSGGASVLFG